MLPAYPAHCKRTTYTLSYKATRLQPSPDPRICHLVNAVSLDSAYTAHQIPLAESRTRPQTFGPSFSILPHSRRCSRCRCRSHRRTHGCSGSGGPTTTWSGIIALLERAAV